MTYPSKSILLAGFMVMWKVVGSAVVPCQQGQPPEPRTGLCTQTVDMTRTVDFKDQKAVDDYVKGLQGFKLDSPRITDVKVFVEQTKVKP